MNEKNDLFGKKHATLWRISMWASGFAPIVFFIFGILAFWQITTYENVAHNQYQTGLISLLSRDPFYIVDLFLKIAKVLIQGGIYFLMLKGIALGLDMIVETDINYREKKIEGGGE
jgi:hypothetical protein